MTVVILAVVLWPGSRIPNPGIPAFDKIVHFCMFLVWTVVFAYDSNLKWYTILAIALSLALLTEVIQLGVEGRTFDVNDLLADGAGVVFGLANAAFIIRITKKLLRR